MSPPADPTGPTQECWNAGVSLDPGTGGVEGVDLDSEEGEISTPPDDPTEPTAVGLYVEVSLDPGTAVAASVGLGCVEGGI